MSEDRANRTAKPVRWIARITGSLVAAFWLFIGIVSGIGEPAPWPLESAILAALIIVSALGVLIAWWREGLGGLVIIGCAVANSVFAFFAAGHSRGMAILIAGGPWLVVGSLFLASWHRSRRSADPQTRPNSQSGEPDGA